MDPTDAAHVLSTPEEYGAFLADLPFDKRIEMVNAFRCAELQGAEELRVLADCVDDPDLVAKFSRHAADEEKHGAYFAQIMEWLGVEPFEPSPEPDHITVGGTDRTPSTTSRRSCPARRDSGTGAGHPHPGALPGRRGGPWSRSKPTGRAEAADLASPSCSGRPSPTRATTPATCAPSSTGGPTTATATWSARPGRPPTKARRPRVGRGAARGRAPAHRASCRPRERGRPGPAPARGATGQAGPGASRGRSGRPDRLLARRGRRHVEAPAPGGLEIRPGPAATVGQRPTSWSRRWWSPGWAPAAGPSGPAGRDRVDQRRRRGGREERRRASWSAPTTDGRSRRRGRAWLAHPGDALLVTVLLRPAVAPVEAGSCRRVAVGVAVAWPPRDGGSRLAQRRDGGGRGASVLCELSGDQERVAWAVVGGASARAAPDVVNARWLWALAGGGPPCRADLLVALLRALGARYRSWLTTGRKASSTPSPPARWSGAG